LERIVVNVAWPYANGPIHVGHVGGSLLSPDIFARYHRLRGHHVLMVSGSDQHGTAVTIRAEREGEPVEQIAEKYHEMNRRSLEWLGISFDNFTKTHTPNHFNVVQEFFLRLYERGYIYPRKTNQYYCTKDRRFLADTYVTGTCPKCGNAESKGNQCEVCGSTFEAGELLNATCVLCHTPAVLRESENLFFALSRLGDRLQEYLSDKEYWRPSVLDFSRNWIDAGLEDRAITRDLDWGIPVPVPGFEGKVIYVWFEAVIGYLSASIEWARKEGKEDAWKDYWNNPASHHFYFMGKDNIPFHTIIWPAMLMVHGDLNLPYNVVANEFVTGSGGRKFSKSRGGNPEIVNMMDTVQPDQLRYYLSSIMPEGRDSEFSLQDMQSKVNNELVATLGNYYHRVLSFAFRNFGTVNAPPSEEGKREIEEVIRFAEAAGGYIEKCEFKKALHSIMDAAQRGNQFFDRCAPWARIRENREECMADIYANLEMIRVLMIASLPFLPFSSVSVCAYLGLDAGRLSWEEIHRRLPGYTISEPHPVFGKLSLESVIPLDLRVGEIVSVRPHPDADRLYILEVVISEEGEKRQIVAGLRNFYSEGELEGKQVVVVANLAHAKLRGYESQGMLLAAEDDGRVRLLVPERRVKPGTLDECRDSGTISIEKFHAMNLRTVLRGKSVVAAYIDGSRTVPLKRGDVHITVDRGDIGGGARIR